MEFQRIVVVGGCGHVGLPLSMALAAKGHLVSAFDISLDSVEHVQAGVMPFLEEGAPQLLANLLNNQQFQATSDPTCLLDAQVIIVVVGTPVDEHLTPDPNSVVNAVMELSKYLNKSQLLILRSTVFPGVTNRVELMVKNEFPGIEIAYCPERIIEGQALAELMTLPQIIGARDNKTFNRASAIFESLGVNTIMTTPEEAELAKLFTNVWRYIKFAIANQFWMMSNDLEVDYEIVRKAISFEYPRAADLPKAGFTAGPCLFKDTMQLSALVQQRFPLGNAAMMINEGTPGYLISKIEEKYNLSELVVGILGVAFKANVDDTRSSLAFKLRKLLSFKAKKVIITDPFVTDKRLLPLDVVLKEADILIIGSPHTCYKNIETDKVIIDIWDLLGNGVRI